ncbi:MICOS complex subunit mic25-a-like [Acipenser oxyrinchus oxyrinchus]|uniref:MICOS complex subunit mic25-a-like n=1 Tax=Acipenser oxyrinchus oxyrinchus TaxID=40147 RepID=A0AAD8CVT0_ACIOX|nr:MICOS complex subunit mic25-a-like [Acipenser oxyrinchus oxyrinchus]
MGGSESTGRKVSFGLDEDDRVRVLHGIKLSEDVVKRMKESSGQSTPSVSDHGSSHRGAGSSTGPKPPSDESAGKKSTEREEELYKRYEREQALVHEELARIAKRERMAGQESLALAVTRERAQASEEKQKTKVMVSTNPAARKAKQLERKEAELKRLDAFYKEQLAHLEKKNIEYYKLTSEQFREAATQAEAHVKKRNVEPVCSNLQSEILRCYREHQHETLNCSDLAREYKQCINAAKKVRTPCELYNYQHTTKNIMYLHNKQCTSITL